MNSAEKRVSLKSVLFLIVSILLISITAFAAAAQSAAEKDEKAISALASGLETKSPGNYGNYGNLGNDVKLIPIMPPHPGMCFFADSDGNCAIDAAEYNVVKHCIKGIDDTTISGYTCNDLFDLNGDGIVAKSDLRVWTRMYYSTLHPNYVPKVDGAPNEIRVSNNGTSIKAIVLAKTGKPVAGIGVIFQLVQSGNPDAFLRGRDVFDGSSHIESYRVFELTNPVTGEATVEFVNPGSEDLNITATIPMDPPKGVPQNMQAFLSIHQNHAPVIDDVPDQVVRENETLTFTAGVSDPDNDNITYTVGHLPEGATFDYSTYTFTWTPTFDKSREDDYIVDFTASDGELYDSIDVSIKVLNTDRAPVFDNLGPFTINENEALNFAVSATDPDGDSVAISASGLPSGASFDTATNTFSWIPAFDQSGEYRINFTATDGEISETKEVLVIVNNVNRVPVMDAIADHSVNENETLSFSVSASDPDGDTLTYSAENLPEGASFDNATLTFTWTPNFNQSGTYTIIFNVTDGELSDSREASIEVSDVNAAPVFEEIGNITGSEDSTLSFMVNASDPAGDNITITASGMPDGASFDAATGIFTWTPDFSQSGNYTVSFSATDGELSDSMDVLIEIINTDREPAFDEIPGQSIAENSTLSFTVHAEDPDGDALAYSAENLPEEASFDASTQTFTWTPGFNQSGNYTISFSASDGELSGSMDVQIEIINTDRAPVLERIALQTVSENSTLTFVINASDPDNDTLSYSAVNLPAGASFDAATQTFSWTPNFEQEGNYTMTFNVTDGELSDSMDVQIEVVHTNQAPVFEPVSNKVMNEAGIIWFTVNATDPEGNEVMLSAENLPQGAFFWQRLFDGMFVWNPQYGQAGNYTITFVANDGEVNGTLDVNIEVLAVPQDERMIVVLTSDKDEGRAPLNVSFTCSVQNGTGPYSYILYFVDEEGNEDIGGSFYELGDSYAYTHVFENGNWTAICRVSDAGNRSVESNSIVITADNINRPPVFNAIPDYTISENQTLTFTIVASDVDGEALAYSASGLPAGASFDASNQTLTWMPDFSQSGNYTVIFNVTDGETSVSAQAYIQVLNVNRPPVIYTISNITVSEGQNLVLNPIAFDPDGDILAYSASDLPTGAAFNTTTQVFSWTPDYDQSGNYSVTFNVTDGQLSDSKATMITVADAFQYRNMTVTLSANPRIGVGHLTTQLTCSVGGGEAPYSYSWTIYNQDNSVWHAQMHWPDNSTSYSFNETLAAGNWTALCLVTDHRGSTAYSNNVTMNITPNGINHAPVIDISYPHGTISGRVNVSWSITDADGDLVASKVYYSRNHGSTWTLINREFSQSGSMTIDTRDYSDGDYMFRVNATDGQLITTYTASVTVRNTAANSTTTTTTSSTTHSSSSNSGSSIGSYYDPDGTADSAAAGNTPGNADVVYTNSTAAGAAGDAAAENSNGDGSVLYTLLGIFLVVILSAIVAFGAYRYYTSQKKELLAEEQPIAY